MSADSNFRPYSKVTFLRVSDGEGGYTKTPIDSSTVYLNVEIHADRVQATCRLETELTVKDLIRIDGDLYEVTQVLRQDGGCSKMLELEKQTKPIEPVSQEEAS